MSSHTHRSDPFDLADAFADRFGLSDEAHHALTLLLAGRDGSHDDARTWDESTTAPDDDELELLLPPGLAGGALIARGGAGEVRRVVDVALRRRLALKTLREELAEAPVACERFVDEAQATSQLQHPGVIPVHGFGHLPDGRPYFLMPEVRGRSLQDLIDAADGTLRRRVEVVRRVCDAVGYAHERRVVHRDLKPENVMVGAHGEVLVLDWGLALVSGTTPAGEPTGAAPTVATDRSEAGLRLTQHGVVMGTPAYMAPEQIVEAEVTPAADVYALGGILYAVLTGRHPREGSLATVLTEVAAGVPVPRPDGPEPLVDLAMACLSVAPGDRPADAVAVGEALQAWLDGSMRTQEAERLLARARAQLDEAAELSADAAVKATAAAEGLAALPPAANEARKGPWWAAADEAERCRHEAEVLELTAEQTLFAALTRAPDHLPSRRLLVQRTRAAHRQAEQARDRAAALRAEVQLRAQLTDLPAPDARELSAYLQGTGRVTLHTDPPGAEAAARRWVRQGRRLVLGEARTLGTTPLDAAPLPSGSWQLTLTHPASEPVVYPVYLPRQGHWDGVAPGHTVPTPVPLPPRGALAADEAYVPPGWFIAGGDPLAPGAVPRRRLWCDGFVIKRFHVSCREVADHLEALVAAGRLDAVRRCGPREWHGQGVGGAPFWVPDEGGRVVVGPDPDGDAWADDWPVMMVDYDAVLAFVRWRAEVEGRPWRLPSEWEWEKAARGVDGRFYPWGDHLEPTWCAMRDSPTVSPPGRDAYPVDTSPYGVRFLGGGAADWCLEGRDAPPPATDRVVVPPVDPSLPHHVGRGGSWSASTATCRAAARGFASSRRGMYSQSARMVRSWPPRPPDAALSTSSSR